MTREREPQTGTPINVGRASPATNLGGFSGHRAARAGDVHRPSTANDGLTPELIKQRFTRMQRSNPWQLVSQVWQRLEIATPSIIRAVSTIPHTYDFDSGTSIYTGIPVWKGGGCLFAAPEDVPKGATDFSQINGLAPVYPDFTHCLKAVGPGVLHLAHPGYWWVCYVGGDTTSRVDVETIDGSDPGIVSRWLSEPGHMARYFEHYPLLASTPTQTLVMRENPYRAAAFLQSQAANTIRISTSSTASSNGYTLFGTGSSITFGDKLLPKAALYAHAFGGTSSLFTADFV